MSDLIDRAEAISRAVELRMYGKPVKMVAVSELERLPKRGETTTPEQADSDRLGVNAGETCTDAISRQAAIDYVDDVPYIKDHPNIGLLWKAWVERLPSAQPDIIRCKDCKYHGYNECLHEFGLIAALDNHYCSYAERREE